MSASLPGGPLGGLLDALPLSYPDAVVVVGTAVVGFVAGLLGPLAVLRQRSMFGDAMSHGTLAGVAVAFLLTGAKVPELLLLGAAISATLAAFAMIALERTGRLRSDTAIGVVLSGLRLVTGSVWPAVVGHAANNTFNVLAFLTLTDTEGSSAPLIYPTGLGGVVGLVLVGAAGAAIMAVAVRKRRRGSPALR